MSHLIKDSFCSYCGTPFPAGSGWPRRCSGCATTSYRNPTPVAVALVPASDEHGTGLLVVRRTIAPRRGQLALPGGFIDDGEDWRAAVVRELGEETGVTVPVEEVRLADVLSAPDDHILVFGLLRTRPVADLPPATPTDETEGWQLLRAPEELAFPLHTRAARAWFAGGYAD